MNTAEIIELGTQPIRPDAPTGAPGRDSPEFEALQTEIRKLEHPDLPALDWNAVVTTAAGLLKTRSKDLLFASYLGVGLLECDGFPGLAAGLQVVRDLISQFWDTLHPELARMRGRTSAIEWLGERGARGVRRRPLEASQVESSQVCLRHVEEISDLLGPRVPDGGALLGELRQALLEFAERAPSPAPAASAVPTVAASASGSSSSGPANVANEGDLDAALMEARRLLRQAGEFLRGVDAANPLAYRAPRFGAWSAIKQLPPNAEGKTQIPPPQPADLNERLAQLAANAQWPGLLQEVEGRFGSAVLWLDLQRYAALALDGLGHEAAAKAVRGELAELLRRFPALPELRFANDLPLAGPETRAWIAERVLAGDASAAPAAAPAPASGSTAVPGGEELAEARNEARELVRAKRLGEALATLERGAARAGALRDWVAWKLEVARLCVDNGHPEAALAQLEGVDDRLRRSTIEDWDPRVCVDVLRSLLQCRQRLPAQVRAEEAQKSRELLGRLTRLDVLAAVEMNGR